MTVAAVLAFGGGAAVRAQTGGLDMDAPSARPATSAGQSSSGQSGGLDMDVNPAAPLATDQAPQPVRRGNIQDGIRVMPADFDRSPLVPPGGGTPIVGTDDLLAPAEPVALAHPKVVTTAQLQADQTSVSLFGIEGFAGEAAQGLQGFVAAAGDNVTCQVQGTTGFVCLLADGTDIAQVALVNGAARTKAEAPDSYREQEVAAQQARRGIWVNLPLPPETVQHPTVQNTATLASGTKVYPLDGLIGFGMPYAGQLQGYIAGAGDSMTCSPQGDPGHYVCLLADNTDIAKVALVNGAARVAPDAPDAYRAQQKEALDNRRGYWATATQTVRATALIPQPQPGPEYLLAAGDDGADGITYVGGAPTALIGGEAVFLTFGTGLGWGYYDHSRRWHGATDSHRYHMERFHPEGRGLRGFDRSVAYHNQSMRHDQGIRSGEFRSGYRPGGPRSIDHAGGYGYGGMVGPVGRPVLPGPVNPGAYGYAGMGGPVGRPVIPNPAAAYGLAGLAGMAGLAGQAGMIGLMQHRSGYGHPGGHQGMPGPTNHSGSGPYGGGYHGGGGGPHSNPSGSMRHQ